jgi:dTDP-glucose 4,6-dehydratase/UDP-glucose 4-epimerase
MKILIVGSKGFIGSHLFDYLSDQDNYEIWGCDVVTDYTEKNYFLIDATNANFEEPFLQHDFDVCVNCSGAASVPDSLIHPLRDFYLNTVYVFQLLETIKKFSAKCKFLNISSAAVYGNPKVLPVTETAALQPLSPYGYHKRQAENICEEFYKFYHLKTCSLRIFSAYGNGLKKQLFWDIAAKAKFTDHLELFGTGNESRDFIHINDITRAIELLIEKADFNGSIYNVANGVEITIDMAARKLLDLLSWKGKLEFDGQQRTGDPRNWRADISKIVALGYKQRIDIDSGLKSYSDWLREEKLV